ncbi:glucose-6-phosphate isomerase [Candidatus Endobugula sertula]|uniref:Glucose-6-phosphate isomerase n=1 Tax=Candidatus Endobugula sertula TaxID=62101 RepID=A0A1D2QNI4_9GAMM|nr:glucose-6-phosphate isomerase [Candidatus Endobugula sertula]
MKTSTKTLYAQLQQHQKTMKTLSLRRLFEDDSHRNDRFSAETSGIYFDYSKNHINSETLKLLCKFAEHRKLSQAMSDLLSGKHVNNTENRPALHTALRFQGKPKTEQEFMVAEAKKKMSRLVNSIETQQWLGFTGKPINTVINIGIGGSDLGPRMITQALSNYKKNVDVKFVANIDGADLCDTLIGADPETTLFIICSKSFTTLETLENAHSAKRWIQQQGCPDKQLKQHFIAISTNLPAAKDFGICDKNILPLWNWVGGRYSLWSTIGLSIALAIGMEHFEELLLGAHQMDKHYATAPLQNNLPVLAGLLSFWYSQFWGCSSYAVLPYAKRLSKLPTYLQQLDMESLGKNISKDGEPINTPTGTVTWGTEGSNSQHSFHQLLHQGNQLIPIDFIMAKKPMSPLIHQHAYLQACCIGQSQALLKGKTLADAETELRHQGLDEASIKTLAPHKVIIGNKPSNTILIEELSPQNLGSLISFYEHKVYTLGVLLNINPFDQWGVELGKQLSQPTYQAIIGKESNTLWDSSTNSLIKKARS